MNQFEQKCDEFKEYIEKSLETNQFKFQTENKVKRDYEELEIEFIRETWLETYGVEPTEEEIEYQKIELTKMKYLVDQWIDEYLDRIEKEQGND